MRPSILAFLFLPAAALGGELKIEDPVVPLAPPGAMAHAAYMTITNETDQAQALIGVSAPGYGMVHMHESAEKDGIVTMSSVDLIEIGPGQTVKFTQGGLHIMLMRPEAPIEEGGSVDLQLEFSDGTTQAVEAKVERIMHGSDGS
ncbi:MAG: copper chaperone PCu(A)C [Pseudomonadota bacterium]